MILNPWTEAHGDHSALIFKNQHGLDSQEYFSLKPVHIFIINRDDRRVIQHAVSQSGNR